MTDFDAAQLPALLSPSLDRLPALVDHARNRLAEARTSAEALEACALGNLALHHAKLTGAANETQGDCVRIITRAEIMIAREIDAAQERGEVATQKNGRSSSVRSSDTSTMDDLGLDRRRVAEWRDLADAGEDAVDEAVDEVVREANASGRSVSKSAVRRKVMANRKAADERKATAEREATGKRRGAAKRDKPSVIPPRPDHLNQLSLWLRNGPGIIRQFADHREAMSLAARFGVSLDPEMVRECTEFLAALCAGLEADRAA